MGKAKKTIRNPHGLTSKQRVVKDQLVESVASGKGLDLIGEHLKVYQTKSRAVASGLANDNLNNQDFRQALIDGLTKREIVGKNSKVEKRLEQGLDAKISRPIITGRDEKGKVTYTYKKTLDHRTILAYIQEINKVMGTYAPEKKQTARLNINLDLSPDQLRQRNQDLQEELAE